MQYFATQSAQLDRFAENVAYEILQTCLVELVPALIRKWKTKTATLDLLAEEFIRFDVVPVVQLFDNGLLEYASALSTTMMKSALTSSHKRKLEEHVAFTYAEKLSLRVFRDFFIHKITAANRISYHLLSSYEAVSKNQLRAFAESIVESVMEDVLHKTNQQKRHEWPQLYCETLSNNILRTAFQDIHHMGKQKKRLKSVRAAAASKQYPAQVTRSVVWHSCFKDGRKATFSKFNKSSLNRIPATRNDHCRKSSEFSPLSTTIDRNQRNAIDLFAEQLLCSLTTMDYENIANNIYYQAGERGGGAKQWGPRASTKSFRIKRNLGSDCMNSKKAFHSRRFVATYADDLSKKILRSATFTDFEF